MTRSAQAISTRTIDFPGNMAATPSSLLMAGRSDRRGEPFWRGSNGTDRDPCHADQRARADRCRNRTRVFLRVVSPRELATPRAGTRYISRRTARERARTVRQLLVRLARNCSDDTADARSDSSWTTQGVAYLARNRWSESISLQRRVREPSVPPAIS